MRIQLEPTDKIVQLVTPTGDVPARVWVGETEMGVPIFAMITRVGADKNYDLAELERALLECPAPVPAGIDEIPDRLTL